MATSFLCCVCKHRENSPGSLHTHHIIQHSAEELSLALLWSHCMLDESIETGDAVEDDILRNSLSKHPQFLLTSLNHSQLNLHRPPALTDQADGSDTLVLMENKVVEEESTKENKSQQWNKLHEKNNMDLYRTNWKKCLVDRSRSEQTWCEENSEYQNNQQQKICNENTITNVCVETNEVKTINLFLPDITITPDLAKQSPDVYLSLLEKRKSSAQAKITSAPEKSPKYCMHNLSNKVSQVKKDNPASKLNITPLSAYNISILKNTSTLHNKIDNGSRVKSPKKEENMEVVEEIIESQSTIVPKPYQVQTPDRRYKCHLCVCAYKKRSHLDRHMRSHTGERPFSCHICCKRFAVKSVLIQHIRVHTGEKPFKCSVCDARFPQTSGLMTHMMLHTGKPYKCDFCPKSFVSNHKLLNHLKNHESTRPKNCTTCNLEFFTLSALEEHKRAMHSIAKRFKCDICLASFKHEVSLKVHLDGHIQELGGDKIIDQLAKQQNTSDG